MVRLNNRPILDYQIEVLRRSGVQDITVVGGYLVQALGSPDYRLRVNRDFASTNMIHTLFCVEDCFGDDVIVSYGDIIYSSKVLDALLRADGEMLVVVDHGWRNYWEQRFADPLNDAETLQMDNKGRILRIGAKPMRLEEVQAQYIGLTRFSGAGLSTLRAAYHNCRQNAAQQINAWGSGRPLQQAYMTDLINHLSQISYVRAVPVNRGWVEIDSEKDLAIATIELGSLNL